MPMNLPTVLTWARMLAIPLLVAAYYLPISPWHQNLVATVVFVAAAITDWFDGYLARRLGQTTAFGAFLDPVADKLLVCAALVMLVQLGRVDGLIAVIIVGREIAISALREWMARIGAQTSVAVHKIGKFKTVAQLVAIPLLLLDARILGVSCAAAGSVLIVVAAVLTVWSMFYYLQRARPHLHGKI
jgi:CDP-diacylglycerol--glycerol-3-phosphate 3-phosphatidyltransferase